jgi:hypothetical protein
MGLFCLASGALLGYTTGNYWQSELALASQLWALLDPGDVLLADRYFGCYRVLALVLGCQADAVCRLHASRRADLRYGKRRGPGDRQVIWNRPKEVPSGLSVSDRAPATLTVRLVRFTVSEKGFRTRQVTLVTTLLDTQKYPVSALAALYRKRWQVELSFRQIKTALAMEHLAVKSPEMIDRSLAMHLLAYQLIRGLMQEAALTWDCMDRISLQGGGWGVAFWPGPPAGSHATAAEGARCGIAAHLGGRRSTRSTGTARTAGTQTAAQSLSSPEL